MLYSIIVNVLENTNILLHENHLMSCWKPHAVKALYWVGSLDTEVQIKVKGRGQAGGQKGSKLTSRKTHQWAGLSHSAQRTRQSQSLLTMRQSLQAPGIQLAIPLQPLYPQPEPDKSLFTWQSAVADPGREKKKVPFSCRWRANPLPTRGYGHMVLI